MVWHIVTNNYQLNYRFYAGLLRVSVILLYYQIQEDTDMKYTRKCPKCGRTEIYRVEAVVGNGYASGNVIPTGLIAIIKVNRCVCGTCGFCEEWIDANNLNTIRRKFPRI